MVWNLEYSWQDHNWMQTRARHNALQAPISVYEVHLGSWMRVPGEGNRSLSYREIAPKLIEYVQRLGFTHVEFLPLMDHPFFGSWGIKQPAILPRPATTARRKISCPSSISSISTASA